MSKPNRLSYKINNYRKYRGLIQKGNTLSKATTLAKNENPLPVALTKEEEEIVNYIGDIEEFLNTPFAQITAVAQAGTPFTILKTGTRWTKHLTQKYSHDYHDISLRGQPLDVEQLLYYIQFEKDIEYFNKQREKRSFKKDDFALLALNNNPVRLKVFEKITELLDRNDMPLRQMCLKEVPASATNKAKGYGPSVTVCHMTQWKSLYDEDVTTE